MLSIVLSLIEDFYSIHIINIFSGTLSIQDFSSTHIINFFLVFYFSFVSQVNFKLKGLKVFSNTHINDFSNTLLYLEYSTYNLLFKIY